MRPATTDVAVESRLLSCLLTPTSIALVGASPRADSYPGKLLAYLRQGGYEGPVHLVNPRRDRIDGERCYDSLASIGSNVDLLLVMVPASAVEQVIRDCGAVGAGVAIVYGSGFAEAGADGVAAQRSLVDAARDSGVRLLGPNCQGVISGPAGLLAAFTAAIGDGPPAEGPIAYVGQSGALGGSFLDKARERQLPIGTWISTGNQADLTAVELGTALARWDEVEILALYLEDLGRGEDFLELATEARRTGKEVVVLRSGVSAVGREAILSHTGAMVTAHETFDVIAHAAGVHTVGDVDELVDVVMTLRSPWRSAGTGVGVVTTSGGAGVLVVDQLTARGFAVPPLDAALQDALREQVPEYAATRNPVDVTAQMFATMDAGVSFGQDFRAVCEVVATSDAVDTLVIVVTMVVGEAGAALIDALAGLADSCGKPVVLVWLASVASTGPGRQRSVTARIPIVDNIPGLVRSLEALMLRPATTPLGSDPFEVDAPSARPGIEQFRDDLAAGHRLLDEWGVPQPSWSVAVDEHEAARLAEAHQGPLAIKALMARLAHRSDVGGVSLDVPPTAAAEVCRSMREWLADEFGLEDVDGFLLQEMATEGLEVLVSIRDPGAGFPPVLTVGLGGVRAEVLGDVVSAPLPLMPEEVRGLLNSLRAAALLGAFRGGRPRDVDALVDTITRIGSGWLAAGQSLSEIELNPVLVHEEGAGVSVVDVLVTWSDTGDCR